MLVSGFSWGVSYQGGIWQVLPALSPDSRPLLSSALQSLSGPAPSPGPSPHVGSPAGAVGHPGKTGSPAGQVFIVLYTDMLIFASTTSWSVLLQHL